MVTTAGVATAAAGTIMLLLLLSTSLLQVNAFVIGPSGSMLGTRNQQQRQQVLSPSSYTSATSFFASTKQRYHHTRRFPLLYSSMIEELEDRYLELANQNERVMEYIPEIVYIMMYNPGTPEEGLHTTEYPKGSGQDVVLAFESLEECVAFSNIIKSDKSLKLPEPIPTPAPYEQMKLACQRMGLSIKVVPAEILD